MRRGTLLAALPMVCLAAAPLAAQEANAAPPERTLFVLLDAVPFSLLDELTDPARGEEALFREFHRPVPMVSTFPSTTSVATVGLLNAAGVERSPGYEARFFDWERRRVRGGGVISYFQIEFPWREFFDWSGKGVARSAVAALTPVKASSRRVRKALDRFMASDRREFFVYIETTDTAAHLKGPKSLEPAFAALDAAIAQAHREHPDRPFRTVLLSDHGIDGGDRPLVNVRKPVKRALRAAGFHFRKRLTGPDDVAWTPFGLVSSFELYVQPEVRAEVARTVASADGVDLCAYPDDGGWTIASGRGDARIERRQDGDRVQWSYTPRGGDPIDYAPIVARLRSDGAGESGWFADADWRAATAAALYPDALYRIAQAFELIENPASMVCSVEKGHMFGLALTETGAKLTQGRLRYTHGALFREATWGFIMSDDPAWQPDGPARFSDALIPFLDQPATVAAGSR